MLNLNEGRKAQTLGQEQSNFWSDIQAKNKKNIKVLQRF